MVIPVYGCRAVEMHDAASFICISGDAQALTQNSVSIPDASQRLTNDQMQVWSSRTGRSAFVCRIVVLAALEANLTMLELLLPASITTSN